jgi:hypothetical protein
MELVIGAILPKTVSSFSGNIVTMVCKNTLMSRAQCVSHNTYNDTVYSGVEINTVICAHSSSGLETYSNRHDKHMAEIKDEKYTKLCNVLLQRRAFRNVGCLPCYGAYLPR